MDRSLDETIAERQRSSRSSREYRAAPPPRRNDYPRDGVRKPLRVIKTNLDDDWVHDRFDEEPSSRSSGYPRSRPRRDEYEDRRSPESDRPTPPPAKIRVDNLHYDLTEEDINDLFERIAPVIDLKMQYDRAGRSEGTAFVTYAYVADARTAIREFDGANAKGQPIRLTLLPLGPRGPAVRRDNPFDRVENPRSLFDRIEAPGSRSSRRRSDSPTGNSDRDRFSHRRSGQDSTRMAASLSRRSDMTRPPPENIDRYVPKEYSDGRSPSRRNGRDSGRDSGREGGRRPGERRERGGRGDRVRSERSNGDAKMVNGRPRKTQEQLDAEMEDYWGSAATTEATPAAPAAPASVAPAPPLAPADDDIEMIE